MSPVRKSMKWSLLLLLFLLAALSLSSFLFAVNQNTSESTKVVYLPSVLKFNQLPQELHEKGVLKNKAAFDLLWHVLNRAELLYPGAYEVPSRLNIVELLRLFRSGRRMEIKLTLSGRLQLHQICGVIGEKLEVDSSTLHSWLKDSSGVKQEEIICFFLSDTYLFNWAGSAKDIWERFMQEYDRYWNEERLQLAESIGLRPEEVITLASIVEAEVKHSEEMPRIAGVYLNRLKKNWLLGADPTLQFLIKEEGRQRILNSDKEIESPYNTYKYLGLPPGPLFTPSKTAIEAVLRYEKHDYMFFCAREDFSGYHNFASSLREHNINANRYRRALDRAGIIR